jgi:MraZ protein
VLVQAYAPALALYPETEWLEVEERMQDDDARPAARHVGAVGDVECGGGDAGRAGPDPDPGALRAAAELEGQALLVGAINKVEIWNPAKFEEAVQGASPDFQKFARTFSASGRGGSRLPRAR